MNLQTIKYIILFPLDLEYMNKLFDRIHEISGKRFPRNFIMRNPFTGSLILVSFCFLFMMIYKPLRVQESRFFAFSATLAIYCAMMYLPAAFTGKALNMTGYFSEKRDWTLAREILSSLIIISVLGIAVYLMGFILEEPGKRLNLSTFLDSFNRIFLICLIPLLLPTVFNFRYLLDKETIRDFKADELKLGNDKQKPVRIISKLKKEELDIIPGNLIYAEADGNYVNFYISADGKTLTRSVRNSIQDIEEQLGEFSFIFRSHRAFLVNMSKITSVKGNSLGYRVRLDGSDSEIPVARNRVSEFNAAINSFH